MFVSFTRLNSIWVQCFVFYIDSVQTGGCQFIILSIEDMVSPLTGATPSHCCA